MNCNFYKIPARQALAQSVKPTERAELVAPGLDGTALVKFEDGTLEVVRASHLQEVPVVKTKPVSTVSKNKKSV